MSELHFTVHARLLTLHVRYICRTTQQLDCDLATFLLQIETHLGHIKFEGRPYLAPIRHALEARPLPSGPKKCAAAHPHDPIRDRSSGAP